MFRFIDGLSLFLSFFFYKGQGTTYSRDRQKEPPQVFSKKICSEKFRKIHRKKPVPESLF